MKAGDLAIDLIVMHSRSRSRHDMLDVLEHGKDRSYLVRTFSRTESGNKSQSEFWEDAIIKTLGMTGERKCTVEVKGSRMNDEIDVTMDSAEEAGRFLADATITQTPQGTEWLRSWLPKEWTADHSKAMDLRWNAVQWLEE